MIDHLYDHDVETVAVRTMVPPDAQLPDVLPTERLNARAMPTRPLRDELRRIPTARNVVTVVMALVQTFGVVIAAAVIDRWWAWLAAFVLMGRGHCLLNILGHEAAHRLLFPNRRANDFVGRWLLAYPTFQAFFAYRRAHFAHHRDEMGPDEPDLGAVRRLPDPRRLVAPQAAPRPARRERVEELPGARAQPAPAAVEARQIVAVQLVLLGASIARRCAAGLRRVDRLVEHAVEVLQPAAGDRRARRDGALRRPAAHDPRHPPEPHRPLLHGAVQHRMAPRPPRRHGRAVAQPATPARRAGRRRMDRAGGRVPDLPGVLAGVLVRRTLKPTSPARSPRHTVQPMLR